MNSTSGFAFQGRSFCVTEARLGQRRLFDSGRVMAAHKRSVEVYSAGVVFFQHTMYCWRQQQVVFSCGSARTPVRLTWGYLGPDLIFNANPRPHPLPALRSEDLQLFTKMSPLTGW